MLLQFAQGNDCVQLPCSFMLKERIFVLQIFMQLKLWHCDPKNISGQLHSCIAIVGPKSWSLYPHSLHNHNVYYLWFPYNSELHRKKMTRSQLGIHRVLWGGAPHLTCYITSVAMAYGRYLRGDHRENLSYLGPWDDIDILYQHSSPIYKPTQLWKTWGTLKIVGFPNIQWKIFRIRKWRYVSTIFQAIFWGDIPLQNARKQRPYIIIW